MISLGVHQFNLCVNNLYTYSAAENEFNIVTSKSFIFPFAINWDHWCLIETNQLVRQSALILLIPIDHKLQPGMICVWYEFSLFLFDICCHLIWVVAWYQPRALQKFFWTITEIFSIQYFIFAIKTAIIYFSFLKKPLIFSKILFDNIFHCHAGDECLFPKISEKVLMPYYPPLSPFQL